MDDEFENIRSDSCKQMGSSWQKSPANIIENSPKDLLLIPIFMSLLLSLLRILSLVNDTSSITRIHTSFHSLMSSTLNCFC